MKKLIVFLAAAVLFGCATSGKIIDKTEFTDSKYPIALKFPDKYYLNTTGAKSTERVSAVRYHRETEIVHGLLLLKPVIVVSVHPAGTSFADYMKEQADKHFDFKYFFDYQVEDEADRTCSGCDAHLVFFTSKVAPAGDHIISIKGDNRGIIAYINARKFYVKVEYIANLDNYDINEFKYVMDNLRIM